MMQEEKVFQEVPLEVEDTGRVEREDKKTKAQSDCLTPVAYCPQRDYCRHFENLMLVLAFLVISRCAMNTG